MNVALPDIEEITKFGVKLEDEGPHPFNPGDEMWNESWFFDWYNEDGSLAGHCRLGLLTGQQRIWLWLFLYDGDGWTAIEEPRLPLSILDRDTMSFEFQGLKYAYSSPAPLQTGQLKVSGFGRVLNGPGAGRITPVDVTVDVTAAGAAHSIGENKIKGHADAAYSTSRYEQAINARVSQKIGDTEHQFDAMGERDHSWGPRMWNMDWHFLVCNGHDLRFQSTVVQIQSMEPIRLGYLSQQTTQNLTNVVYDLTYHEDNPWRAVEGSYLLEAEDGTRLTGQIEPISSCEIDLTHSFTPPQLSWYRRTLVRCVPDDGSTPLIGWLEINRMLG
jgi:hypothetical protein